MNLEQIIRFDLRLTGPCTQCHNGPVKQIYSIEDLAEYTRKYPLHMNIPYTIVIERVINKKVTDKYKILVGDKLIYPNDIDAFLKDQYKKTFNFDLKKTEKKPVMLDGVPGHCFVRWHYLTNADVFVERKTLNQILPVKTGTPPIMLFLPIKTGKPPVGLVELFNKKTENVR